MAGGVDCVGDELQCFGQGEAKIIGEFIPETLPGKEDIPWWSQAGMEDGQVCKSWSNGGQFGPGRFKTIGDSQS